MKITVSVPQEISLDLDTQEKVAVAYLRDIFRWGNEDFICLESQTLLRKKTYQSSHTWSEYLPIRSATKDEIALQTILDYLKNK
jgi:hypothetical protein